MTYAHRQSYLHHKGRPGLTPQESLQLTLQGTVDAEGNMYDFPPERFMEE